MSNAHVRNRQMRCTAFNLLVLSLVWSGCNSANDDARKEAEPARATSSSAIEIQVPDGTPEELFQFMVHIEQQEMGVASSENDEPDDLEQQSHALRRVMTARVKACDKILEMDVPPESRVTAVQMKLDSLRTLLIVDPDGYGKQFEPFIKSLSEGNDPLLARMAKATQFQATVNDFVSYSGQDPEAILADLRALLGDPDCGPMIFNSVRDAVSWMFQNGQVEVSAEALRVLGERFKEHEDQNIADEARDILMQSAQLMLSTKVKDVVDGKQGAMDSLTSSIREMLSEDALNKGALQFSMQTAQMIEFSGNVEAARQLYGLVYDRFETAEDPALVQQVKRSVDLAYKRLDLVGQPLEIEGVLLDGSKFDWRRYNNHPVLVCFWASWYEPWMAEVKNIIKSTGPFRNDGLEIVTVNLDDDRNALERYLQNNTITWPIVVNMDPTAAGFENPNAIKYGVEAIPFMLLVDREGKVFDIHVMGGRLPVSLERLMKSTAAIDQSRRGPAWNDGQQLRFVSLLEEPPENNSEASDEAVEVTSDDLSEINPYSPPEGLSPFELLEFILDMDDKPKSIQNREGFSDGIAEAADLLLATDAKDQWKMAALLTKLKYLHRDACFGRQNSEARLRAEIARWQTDQRKPVAAEIEFLKTEQRILTSDELPVAEIPELLSKLVDFFRDRRLTARHLRIASCTVHAINRISDDDKREEYFQQFGKFFAASDDKQLAQYGKRLSRDPQGQSDLVGKPMEISGVTVDGLDFELDQFQGGLVVVDFWATWCGPCREAMPELKKLYQQYHARGLNVIGISLDEDADALSKFLAETELPWDTIAGEAAAELADKYQVRAIPRLVLVDPEGIVAFVGHEVAALKDEIAKSLKE